MKEASQKIYTTTDYGLFKQIGSNRTLKPGHVESLKKSMQEKYLFTIIFVNQEFQIIDGQHRFQAIQDLGLAVNYVVLPEAGWDDVQRYNNNLKAWSTEDYAHGYIEMGKKDYLIFRDFRDKWDFENSVVLAMLSGFSRNAGSTREAFKNGTFKVFKFEQAERAAKAITSLKEYYPNVIRDRRLIYTLLDLFGKEEFDFGRFRAKLKKYPQLMKQCATKKQCVEMIEELYNYRQTDKVNLRF